MADGQTETPNSNPNLNQGHLDTYFLCESGTRLRLRLYLSTLRCYVGILNEMRKYILILSEHCLLKCPPVKIGYHPSQVKSNLDTSDRLFNHGFYLKVQHICFSAGCQQPQWHKTKRPSPPCHLQHAPRHYRLLLLHH